MLRDSEQRMFEFGLAVLKLLWCVCGHLAGVKPVFVNIDCVLYDDGLFARVGPDNAEHVAIVGRGLPWPAAALRERHKQRHGQKGRDWPLTSAGKTFNNDNNNAEAGTKGRWEVFSRQCGLTLDHLNWNTILRILWFFVLVHHNHYNWQKCTLF